jgi:hypothetical protein
MCKRFGVLKRNIFFSFDKNAKLILSIEIATIEIATIEIATLVQMNR